MLGVGVGFVYILGSGVEVGFGSILGFWQYFCIFWGWCRVWFLGFLYFVGTDLGFRLVYELDTYLGMI